VNRDVSVFAAPQNIAVTRLQTQYAVFGFSALDDAGKRRRPRASAQQTMKAARQRQSTKRGADHLREDQSWSERHGMAQQMSATRFAAPSFPCLRNRRSRPAT